MMAPITGGSTNLLAPQTCSHKRIFVASLNLDLSHLHPILQIGQPRLQKHLLSLQGWLLLILIGSQNIRIPQRLLQLKSQGPVVPLQLIHPLLQLQDRCILLQVCCLSLLCLQALLPPEACLLPNSQPQSSQVGLAIRQPTPNLLTNMVTFRDYRTVVRFQFN